MELTLRAAHKLVEKIKAHIRTIETNPGVSVNTHSIEDSNVLFVEHRRSFEENMSRVDQLMSTVFRLRESIRRENDVQDIDSVVAERSFNLDRIAHLQRVVNSAKAEGQINSAAALKSKTQQILSKGANSSYHDDTVSFSVVGKEQLSALEDQISTTKRLIESLEDQLLNKNIVGKIFIDPSTVEFLHKERLV